MVINLTFEEAAEKLQNLYKSAEYNELIKKRSQTTYLEAMGKQRSETIFSSLIKWIIDNKDFNKESESSPLVFLLRLLALTAVKQEKDEDTPKVETKDSNGNKTEEKRPLMDYALRNCIQANDIVISEISCKTEEKTYSSKGDGRIDLVVECNLSRKTGDDLCDLRILLENKVDSVEGDKQCERYFDHFINGEGYKEGKNNVFVFLSIDKPKKANITSPHFIKITYQELLENVLNLILVQANRYPEDTVRYLKDFMDTLTTLNTKGYRTIATSPETKSLLSDFYKGNKDIIDAAVLAKYETNLDSQTKVLLDDFYKGNRDIINAAVFAGCTDTQIIRYAKLTKGGMYNITYHGRTKSGVRMNNVAYEAIMLLLLDNKDEDPKNIEGMLSHSGDFWKKFNSTPNISGYTKKVDFSNGDTYYVHTARYKKDGSASFNNLLDDLEHGGFDIQYL